MYVYYPDGRYWVDTLEDEPQERLSDPQPFTATQEELDRIKEKADSKEIDDMIRLRYL